MVPLRDLIEHTVPGGIEGHDDGVSRWLTIEADDVDHDTCSCLPRVEHVPARDGGPDGWLVVHASLDGREAHE